MPKLTLKIRKYPAKEIIEKFIICLENIFANIPGLTVQNISSLHINTFLLENHFSTNKPNSIDEIKNKLNNLIKDLEEAPYISVKHINLQFTQPQNNQSLYQLLFDYQDNNLFDNLSFDLKNETDQQAINIHKNFLKIFNENFIFFKDNKVDIRLLDEQNKNFLETYQQHILELKEINNKTLSNIAEQAKNWDQVLLETKSKLDKKYHDDHSKLEEEYQEKHRKLAEREKEHEEKLKTIDDRDRIHARRDLLNKIEEKVIVKQQEITLSEKTIQKRTIINWTVGVFLSISGFISLGSLSWLIFKVLYTGTTFEPLIILPIGTFTLFFATTLIYFIRWNSQWYKQHADLEFNNKKFLSDILRANWLIEMFFEAQDDKQTELPNEMYKAFSKNLFENSGSTYKSEHPVEDILRALKNVKSFKVANVEVENKEEKK
jgi:hypothetical protein